MNILALDTSGAAISAAIASDGKLLARLSLPAGQKHSVACMPVIDRLLAEGGLPLCAIDCFAVTVGPGSFTGIRIGIAVVQGLALALDRPCAGVSSLESMAFSARRTEGLLAPCIDARAGRVYNALFSCKNGVITRDTEDRLIACEQLKQHLKGSENSICIIANNADLCYNEECGTSQFSCKVSPSDAGDTALLAFQKAPVPPARLQPLYLQASQAERMILERGSQSCT